ncbi:preprotein translocase subunit SecE [Candidatus Wolfebacteria bacterium]|nr:preprotein translocase subunit SecE [Candidatus Wolfebacteria bacterium]
MSRFITYLRETRGELKHVSWPTRRQALVFTVVVIIVSLATAAYLGLFDYIFEKLLQAFII